MPPHLVPLQETRMETRVSNSRFIATLAPAFTVEEARAFIQRIRAEFSDATHNVPAFVIGHGDSVTTHCSDAGEPSGTAGRPMLAVLQGSGLGDAVVVVTRYFGGTKLGTGGLVRAYSGAVRAVVDACPRAIKTPAVTALLVIPYNLLERVRRLAPQHCGAILEESFTADVTLTLRFLPEDLPGFQADLLELSNGSIQAEVMEQSTILLPVQPGK
ncbi:MAG TPA: YigZ family protein [Anaerolineaceae bacterium]|nr:YigZ family protein [Anaerolineaceae bacterium]HQP60375.1 YigZ family protein [Anaerolineaceae bacterium]